MHALKISIHLRERTRNLHASLSTLKIRIEKVLDCSNIIFPPAFCYSVKFVIRDVGMLNGYKRVSPVSHQGNCNNRFFGLVPEIPFLNNFLSCTNSRFIPVISPSQSENSVPGSVLIIAGYPDHSSMVYGFVIAEYISEGSVFILNVFLKVFIICRSISNQTDIFRHRWLLYILSLRQ